MGSAMPGVESIGRPGSGFLLWLRVQRAKKIWTEVWSAMLGGADPDSRTLAESASAAQELIH